MKFQELKVWPDAFTAMERGKKNFEFRKDDRGFELDDILNLREWDPKTEQYTGRIAARRISYILRDQFGVPPGYVVLGVVLA